MPSDPRDLVIPAVEIDPTPPVDNHPCDRCSGLDDHPMLHVAGTWRKDARTIIEDPSLHFDCFPDELVPRLGTDATAPQLRNLREAIKAAKAGVRGDALRGYIHALARQYNDGAVGAGGGHKHGLDGPAVIPYDQITPGNVDPHAADMPELPPLPGR